MYFLIKLGIIYLAGGPFIWGAVLFHCVTLSSPYICLAFLASAFEKHECDLHNLSSFLIV